jgi:hypothetical protein
VSKLSGSAAVSENPRFSGTHILSALANGLGGLMDKEIFGQENGPGARPIGKPLPQCASGIT